MLLKFGLISGLGWLIDFSIFVALGAAGFIPGVANGIAATVAVTFVYFSSLRPIFKYEGHYMMRKLMAYWLYQIVAVTLASLAVNFLATVGMHSIVAKIVVTPFTFLANYLFMKWLAEVGRSGT
ncbi:MULTISPECIES: GtrA family protein [Achromobacter]|uniref:GtrA family protein n=1 Tax=Achromobacter TaxID=222 RepID=UPI0006C85D43|nr:GtrA family protein [Achromobacter kerstersii]